MIKRSLVVVDASPRSAVRLHLAQHLAGLHAGEVTVLYGVLPSLLAVPWAAAEGMAGAARYLADLDETQRQRARTLFQQASDNGRSSWVDGGDTPYAALLDHAFRHDLLVLGQPDPADEQTGALPVDLLPAAITDSGRPALVVPARGRFETTDGPVLVAWKPTREAARALTAALPWLRRTRQVHVATRDEAAAGPQPLRDLEHWLRLQGVRSPVQWHALGDGDVGDHLLGLGVHLGTALLVMGCYGHGRAREWVLGGATRTVLRSMNVPVLMVH
jgi:nucleotide-binding universal stress UspA family protein